MKLAAPVCSKPESIRRLNAGEFGNHARVWPSLAALRASGFTGNVVIRSKRPGFATVYNVPQCHLDSMLSNLAGNGHPLESLYFNEVCPDEHLVLQGELIGRDLMYSVAPKPMKWALLEDCRHASGSATESVLRWAMNDSSYEDFQALRERHPYAVIEFGCYGVCLGNLPHRNTLIWEVRDRY